MNRIYGMKIEEYNQGHCFRVPEASYPSLDHALSRIPGVKFMQKRRFLWFGQKAGPDFTFKGHLFEIEKDEWDGVLWIMPKDKQKHETEIRELREAIEKASFNH